MLKTYAKPLMNENAGRRYPLRDDEGPDIPDGALLDCRIVSSHDVDPNRIAITHASIGDGGAAVTIDVDGVDVDVRAEAGSHMAFGETPGIHAWVAIGDAHAEFSGRAMLVPTVVVCDSRRLRSLQSKGSYLSPGLTSMADFLSGGAVMVVDGYNVDASVSGDKIVLAVSRGGGIGEYCSAVDGGQTCGGVMYSINGELPDDEGDIRISGGGGITVSQEAGKHEIVVSLDERVHDILAEDCE